MMEYRILLHSLVLRWLKHCLSSLATFSFCAGALWGGYTFRWPRLCRGGGRDLVAGVVRRNSSAVSAVPPPGPGVAPVVKEKAVAIFFSLLPSQLRTFVAAAA